MLLRRLLLSSMVTLFLIWAAAAQVTTHANQFIDDFPGVNLFETVLTTANIDVTQFGKLCSYLVDGPVSVQPVHVTGVIINGTPRNVLYVATTKRTLYAFDADTLCATPLWIGDSASNPLVDRALRDGPVAWNAPGEGPLRYAWSANDVLKAYRVSAGRAIAPALLQGGVLSSRDSGGALSLSANGVITGTGIVWAATPMAHRHGEGASVLRAFDAETLRELWTSEENATRDRVGRLPRSVRPVIANGRVYIPTLDGSVAVYGLLPVPVSRALHVGEKPATQPPLRESDAISAAGIDVGTDAGAIGIDFVGSSTTRMTAAESAGVVPKPNWNSANGVASADPLPLVDEAGTLTGAAVTWAAKSGWATPIADASGGARMMKGYLDTSNTSASTVTVTGLPPRSYDVYVYIDGDNRSSARSAAYTISGAGIATTTVNVTDAANTNFSGNYTRASNSAGNYVLFSVVGEGFTLTATPTAPASGTRRAPINGIQIVPAATAPVPAAIGIKFLGSSTIAMGANESAGVVPKPQWNNAAGVSRSTPLALVSDTGVATTASVTWSANNGWMTPIADQPGNARLMKGYLDTSNSSVTTVTVVGLPSATYDVYVYVDGDNGKVTRTAAYRITGPGITAATVNLTDQANTNFSGTFVPAAGTSGNYVKFTITSNGFTLTATPGTSTNTALRAPVNAIQIVASTSIPVL